MTTTLDGQTVPYIVRWERGTINRFIYSIAVLAPTTETDPGAPDDSLWNGRVMFSLQGGVAIGHHQGTTSTGAMLPDAQLRLGYAVLNSTGLRTNTHYNLELSGETALMLKEHFIEDHGVPGAFDRRPTGRRARRHDDHVRALPPDELDVHRRPGHDPDAGPFGLLEIRLEADVRARGVQAGTQRRGVEPNLAGQLHDVGPARLARRVLEDPVVILPELPLLLGADPAPRHPASPCVDRVVHAGVAFLVERVVLEADADPSLRMGQEVLEGPGDRSAVGAQEVGELHHLDAGIRRALERRPGQLEVLHARRIELARRLGGQVFVVLLRIVQGLAEPLHFGAKRLVSAGRRRRAAGHRPAQQRARAIRSARHERAVPSQNAASDARHGDRPAREHERSECTRSRLRLARRPQRHGHHRVDCISREAQLAEGLDHEALQAKQDDIDGQREQGRAQHEAQGRRRLFPARCCREQEERCQREIEEQAGGGERNAGQSRVLALRDDLAAARLAVAAELVHGAHRAGLAVVLHQQERGKRRSQEQKEAGSGSASSIHDGRRSYFRKRRRTSGRRRGL